MLKKMFQSVIDICRPGVDDASCAWGESTQKQSPKTVAPQKPLRASELEVTDPTKPPSIDPVS